ncbi:MAG: polyphosphate polymerase domain-containing protein [Clostridia bacterium]|nr:polyphosphate polymerase domain-containing protein [Clostridia bacterium]
MAEAYRHEWKHEINYADLLAICQRLRAVASPDPHAKDGRYFIRSLYFDTPSDKALREKIDGTDRREKFRIRYYDFDTSFIRLEKKSKRSGLGTKYGAPLTVQQAQAIIDGDLIWMMDSENPLIREFYCRSQNEGLRPKTLVDYTREPYYYGPGNVRVTFDYNIRTGLSCTDLFDPDCVTVPAPGSGIILEVKWDTFLPQIIRDCVQTPGRHVTAFSKYAQCRMYD